MLSTILLAGYFGELEPAWLRVVEYDLPTVCLFVLFAWWIQAFIGSRRRLEEVLRRHGEELEAAVKARAGEILRINAEYKIILDAAPFGIVLFGPGRIVQRCNSEYERMIGYSAGELLGQQAPLPEEQREAWKAMEDTLRAGQPIIN